MRLDVALASGLAINVRLDIADRVARRAAGRALLRGRARDERSDVEVIELQIDQGRAPGAANDVVDAQTERHVEKAVVRVYVAHADGHAALVVVVDSRPRPADLVEDDDGVVGHRR